MDPSRPDRILHEWDEVAAGARRPATPPKRVGVRSVASGTSIAGAGVLLAAVLVAAVWLGRPGANGGIGAIGSPLPTATPTAMVTPTADAKRDGASRLRRPRRRRPPPDTHPAADRGTDARPVRSVNARGPDHQLGRRRRQPDR